VIGMLAVLLLLLPRLATGRTTPAVAAADGRFATWALDDCLDLPRLWCVQQL
jgi:hypothetical protein